MSESPTSKDELVARARSLRGLLAAEAAEAERLRRPTDQVIHALEDAEIFKLMVPRRYGGLELGLDAFLDVGLALAEGDTSMAWVATFYIEHNWMLCQFPRTMQEALFRDRSYVLAPGMIAPTGSAVAEDGGFRLNGRWQWGTGAMHGAWVIAGAPLTLRSGEQDMRFFALPMSQATIVDTWHVDGMCGTGSHDIVIENVLVPDDHAVSVLAMANGRAPGAEIHDGPLYRTPMVPILCLAASMPAVGTAKAAVERFRERCRSRIKMNAERPQSEESAAQAILARAEIDVRQGELLLQSIVDDVQQRRNEASLEERAGWSAAFAVVVHQCRAVLQTLSRVSGGDAHRLDDPLQRAVRDVNMLSSHVVFDLEAQLINRGRMLLGLSPSGRLF